jgi:hypothetical protein
MLRVGFDLDGVVADFRTAFLNAAAEVLGRQAIRKPSSPLPDFDAVTPADAKRVWNVIAETPNWWLGLPPYEPAQIARLYQPRASIPLGKSRFHFLNSVCGRLRAVPEPGVARGAWVLPAVGRHGSGPARRDCHVLRPRRRDRRSLRTASKWLARRRARPSSFSGCPTPRWNDKPPNAASASFTA